MFGRKMQVATALLITAALAGCSGGVPSNGGNTNKSEKYDKKLTYTINVMSAEMHGNDAAYKYLCDKFNVDFEFIPITMSDWHEKVRIWVAGNDMPDVMWADIQNFNMNEYRSWVKQGVIKELPEIDSYPNLKKIADLSKSDKYFQVDGKRYAWPSYVSSYLKKDAGTNGFYYRKDWAKKLGMQKDNDEYTWDEFKALAKAFVEKDPGNNGPGKTIGIAGDSGAFPHFAGVMQSSPYWEQYVEKDGKYVWGLGLPETLDGIKEGKKIFDEGLLWRDQILSKQGEGLAKFEAGLVGIEFANWTINQVKGSSETFKKNFPDMDVDNGFAPMFVKGKDGKFFGQSALDYWTITTFNSKLDDEKFKRILDIWDWIASDEGYEMATLGVKDVDWEETNGQIEIIPPTTKVSNFVLKMMVRQTSNFALTDPRTPKVVKDKVELVVNKLATDQATIRRYDYDLYFFTAPNFDKYGSLYEEGKEQIKKLMVSSSDPEKDWNAWKASVQPKVDAVLSELNTQLLAKKEQQ